MSAPRIEVPMLPTEPDTLAGPRLPQIDLVAARVQLDAIEDFLRRLTQELEVSPSLISAAARCKAARWNVAAVALAIKEGR